MFSKDPTEVYKKALRVITSSENEIHLEGARNYCENFKSQYNKLGHDKVLINVYYEALVHHIKERQDELHIDHY